jgi:hypothetical protein
MMHGHWTLDDERWVGHRREHEIHDQFHSREHETNELAISKQETATTAALQRSQEVIDARFETTNEWRGAFSDREREFMTKAEYQSAHGSLVLRIDSLEDKDIARTTREQERERAQLRTMALIGLAAAVGGFMLSLVTRLLGIAVGQ